MSKLITPKIEDLYVGQLCFMLDTDLAWKALMEKIEIEQLFKQGMDYKVHVDELFKHHILTKSDIRMFEINPKLLERELKIEKIC